MPMVKAPFFSGLPLITANCAPAGSPGGPSIHLSSAGVAAAAAFFTAAWCLVLATAGAAITNALSERRMKLFMTCPLCFTELRIAQFEPPSVATPTRSFGWLGWNEPPKRVAGAARRDGAFRPTPERQREVIDVTSDLLRVTVLF